VEEVVFAKHICTTKASKPTQAALKQAVEMLPGCEPTSVVDFNTTHLVTEVTGKQKATSISRAPQSFYTTSSSISSSSSSHSEDRKQGPLRLAARTIKYLMAVSMGKLIVGGEWLQDSVAQGRWLDEGPYLVTGDTLHGNTGAVADIKRRVGEGDFGLFHGYTFRVHGDFAANSEPPTKDVARLLELNGGVVMESCCVRKECEPTRVSVMLKNQRDRGLQPVPTNVMLLSQRIGMRDSRVYHNAMNAAKALGLTPVSLHWVLDSISCGRAQTISKKYKPRLSSSSSSSSIRAQLNAKRGIRPSSSSSSSSSSLSNEGKPNGSSFHQMGAQGTRLT
jgi:hypothetical protein